MNGSLSLTSVTIALGTRVLVPGLWLDVAPGEVVTVMGPSGSGKTTLLDFIGGTLDSCFTARGQVALGDVDITRLAPDQRRVGVLFQDDLLFPHLSVGGNLAFGLSTASGGRKARRERIESALEDAGLGGFHGRDPSTLSGGQRARVAVLRTLLSEPCALLLDEPFSKLDDGLREDFRRFVFDHAAAQELPVLMVTHDMTDALAAGGPIVAIDGKERSRHATAVSGTGAPTGRDRAPKARRLRRTHT